MSKIRVAAITFDWYPFDPLVRRMSEAAVDNGCLVDVICLRQKHEEPYEICNGVNIHRLPMSRGFGHSLLITILSWCWFTLLTAIVVARLHLKHRYDVIHVHNMPDFLVFSALIPRILGAKVILHVQDVCPELMAAKSKGYAQDIITCLAIWQERISTAFAHHVITVGRPFEDLLLQRGVPKEKLSIVLNSADPKIFPPSRRKTIDLDPYQETRPLILMYHGTDAERNGLDTAIRALALALPIAPHLRLDMKVRGENLSILKDLAQQLGVSDRVNFSAPCPLEKLVDFVMQGDIGIIPYRSDGFMDLVLPTKAYEYAWMHRPMIASNTAAIRSMFRPESIALCNPSNPESFANAIIDLYQHPEKQVSMAANAAQDYIPYQWENMAQRYPQLLRSLCGKQQQEPEQDQTHLIVKEPTEITS
jgi:glycosyltransferase involved in cell wall biosynthesis